MFDSYDTFHTESYIENIYDEDYGDNPTVDIKEIIERVLDTEFLTNKICNIDLLIYGDYNCNGNGKTAPCACSAIDGFCWQHSGGACR